MLNHNTSIRRREPCPSDSRKGAALWPRAVTRARLFSFGATMSKSLTNPTFDYSQVTAEEKAELIYYEGQISQIRERVATDILLLGKQFHGAQQTLANHGDGTFGAYIDSQGITRRSAYRAIEAFNAFGDCATVAQIETSAMYALASNDKAKKQALKLVDKGVKVTQAMAKELIEKATPKARAGSNPAVMPAEEMSDRPFEEQADLEPAPVELPEPVDLGKCPNCAGTKWTEDDVGFVCAKCNHPHGEPTGGADEDRVATARSKVVKTAEALMRAVDDLQHLVPRNTEHAVAIEHCKRVLALARAWK